MDASLVDALTCCPACKQHVLLSNMYCPYCNAAADTTSAFLSFRRPDGSAGMIDQLTTAYLRSPHSEPNQTDLDKLISTTSRVQIMEMVFLDNRGTFQPRLEFAKANDLSMLWKCLAIQPTSWHLMMIGEVCIEFYNLEERLARIEIVGTNLLRWSERWKTDARLTNPILLAEFLQSQGFGRLREDMDLDVEQERKSNAQHAAWLATWETATPPGLSPLVEDLSNEIYSSKPIALPRALAVLAEQYASRDEQILALFAWYGHGSGPWSGYPCSEAAPEVMLQTFSADELHRAMESQTLSAQHLEGVARFMSRWVPKQHERARRQLIDEVRSSRIRDIVLAHVQSSGNASKIEEIVRAIAR